MCTWTLTHSILSQNFYDELEGVVWSDLPKLFSSCRYARCADAHKANQEISKCKEEKRVGVGSTSFTWKHVTENLISFFGTQLSAREAQVKLKACKQKSQLQLIF